MKKITFLLLISSVLCANAQENSRNGREFCPNGLFRVFIVFADVTDDTLSFELPGWTAGQLPIYANDIMEFSAITNPTKYVTKYFNEASFGSFSVIGDYYPELIKFNLNDMSSAVWRSVITYLNQSVIGRDIITHNGFRLSDFDLWSLPHGQHNYMPKQFIGDNRLDILLTIWRHNSKFRKEPSGGSCGIVGNYNGYPIKYLNGFNGSSNICNESPHKVFRHEFSHTLIGDNNYHTGGAGTKESGTFLSNIGGYSMLSSYNANLDSYNGWDRWWLGWKHPNKNYYISAVDALGNEVAADLEYGETLTNNEFILRDFANYGDAIRIKLPYLKSINNQVRNQYLWIENHQIINNTIEYDPGKAKGIRYNIQVGNDNLEANLFASRANYYVPLSAFGNYDFDYIQFDTSETDITWFDAYTTSERANPFTGYHPIMLPAIDAECGQAHVDDKIQSNEFVTVHRIYKDGVSACGHLPVFGNNYDAFPVGASLRIASNPPNTPLLTYRTTDRQSDGGQDDNPLNPADDDNRYIWLNGLRIDILENYSDGSVKVRIVWDDYDVDNDVRWCGPIMLTENIYLKEGHTILLDYGLMPTRPYNPILFNDNKVFADPTVFTCRNGSYFKQEANSTVTVANQSIMILESGSVYEINDGAVLDLQASGSLLVKSGATLHVKGSGRVEVRDGGYICFEDGASILLDNTLSVVNLHDRYIQGINPVHNNLIVNCSNVPLPNFHYIGQGAINTFSGRKYIQNRTYTSDAYETGTNIRAGHHVTNLISHGNVVIEHGANVVFDAEKSTVLERGTEVKAGGTLIVR